VIAVNTYVTGTTIRHLREKRNMTQAKLAEILGVSSKTISKWETGKGIPDSNLLPKICEIFEISINELLNGERFKKEEYTSKAEEKLLALQKEKQESDKRLLRIEIVFACTSLISFLTILFASTYAINKLNIIVLPVIAIVVSFAIFIISMLYCLRIEQKAGYYICKKCNHKFVPTFKQISLSMHICRTRYIKCPHCKKYSWNRKIIK
jgi:transcriptional regulator with XRE-family HTH domain/DNA-directed RNA polymerase subunit RPC12/RpoP